MAELPKFPHLIGNWGQIHNSDVRFQIGSKNEPGLRMRIEKYTI